MSPARDSALLARPYSDPQDLRRIQAIVQDRWRELGVRAGWHVGDFAWWIGHDQVFFDGAADRIRLWLDDRSGEAVASALIDGHGALDVPILPSVSPVQVVADALRWYEDRVARVAPSGRFRGRPRVYAMEGDDQLIALLEDRGYAPAIGEAEPVLGRSLTDAERSRRDRIARTWTGSRSAPVSPSPRSACAGSTRRIAQSRSNRSAAVRIIAAEA